MSDVKKGSPALQLSAVQKSYGDHRVLCGVDLKVMPGQILGLLGKNGAGKSTLIEILCGLRQANSGLISVCGMNPAKESVGHLIGYAPQDLGIYPDLTVMENLTYYGQLEGLSRKRSFARAEEVMELLGLTGEKTKRARHLSGGQKRRLHSGMAIMHEPKVIFMDEPTVGADVEARSRILHTMQSLAKNGAAIIYTSHYLAEFEELGADIAIIHNGRIAAEGSLEKIIANYARSSVSLQFSQPVPSIDGWQSNGVELLRENNANNAGSVIADLLANPALRENTLENVHISQASLQSAYLSIVGEETNHDNA